MSVDLEPCDCDDKCGHFNLRVQEKWFSLSRAEAQNLARMLKDRLGGA